MVFSKWFPLLSEYRLVEVNANGRVHFNRADEVIFTLKYQAPEHLKADEALAGLRRYNKLFFVADGLRIYVNGVGDYDKRSKTYPLTLTAESIYDEDVFSVVRNLI